MGISEIFDSRLRTEENNSLPRFTCVFALVVAAFVQLEREIQHIVDMQNGSMSLRFPTIYTLRGGHRRAPFFSIVTFKLARNSYFKSYLFLVSGSMLPVHGIET